MTKFDWIKMKLNLLKFKKTKHIKLFARVWNSLIFGIKLLKDFPLLYSGDKNTNSF